jgi:2-hydroxy-3-keto-5-methylthiopentenyl-1-phosphate phosphatase
MREKIRSVILSSNNKHTRKDKQIGERENNKQHFGVDVKLVVSTYQEFPMELGFNLDGQRRGD